jgi:hypothetical protein
MVAVSNVIVTPGPWRPLLAKFALPPLLVTENPWQNHSTCDDNIYWTFTANSCRFIDWWRQFRFETSLAAKSIFAFKSNTLEIRWNFQPSACMKWPLTLKIRDETYAADVLEIDVHRTRPSTFRQLPQAALCNSCWSQACSIQTTFLSAAYISIMNRQVEISLSCHKCQKTSRGLSTVKCDSIRRSMRQW